MYNSLHVREMLLRYFADDSKQNLLIFFLCGFCNSCCSLFFFVPLNASSYKFIVPFGMLFGSGMANSRIPRNIYVQIGFYVLEIKNRKVFRPTNFLIIFFCCNFFSHPHEMKFVGDCEKKIRRQQVKSITNRKCSNVLLLL